MDGVSFRRAVISLVRANPSGSNDSAKFPPRVQPIIFNTCQGERKAGTSTWFRNGSQTQCPSWFGKPFILLDFLRPLWATQSYDNSAQMFPLTPLSVEITFHIHLQSTPLQRPDVGKPSSQGNHNDQISAQTGVWCHLMWEPLLNRQHVFFLLTLANISKSIK